MIEKITVLRGTVFNGTAVEKGDVLDVAEAQQGPAHFLIKNGKAVEGEFVVEELKAKNKAVSAKDTERK